jgi:hypothetical protein
MTSIVDRHDPFAACGREARRQRRCLAIVAPQPDNLHAGILQSELAQHVRAFVGRTVIDKHYL